MNKHICYGIYTNDVSKAGLEHGYIDYAALAGVLQGGVLANQLLERDLDVYHGELYEYYDEDGERITEDEYCEIDNGDCAAVDIFQGFIVTRSDAEMLAKFDEIVLHDNELNLFIWGVTHWGTSWDWVLTRMKLDGTLDE